MCIRQNFILFTAVHDAVADETRSSYIQYTRGSRKVKRIMKKFEKKIVISALVLGMGAATLSGCGRKEKTIGDFSSYAIKVDEFTVPDNVRIVGLGEATHGNVEFQELKLDVFSRLVETANVRGLVLEGDFGGCAIANDYILYDRGDVDTAIRRLGYRVYCTEQMKELVTWMHDYNAEATEDDKVRLYGADVQYFDYALEYMGNFLTYCESDYADEFAKKAAELYEEDGMTLKKTDKSIYTSFLDEAEKKIEENRESFTTKTDDEEVERALQNVQALRDNVEYCMSGQMSGTRDAYMKEMIDWALGMEEEKHDAKVMFASHNGHMSRAKISAYNSCGMALAEEYGEDYFAIGTDYYNTECNLPEGAQRITQTFCSDDILAAQLKDMEENMYYLDFDGAADSAKLSEILNKPMTTGSLGESYTPAMKVVKKMVQVNVAPSKMYDAMIFVYDATPTEILEK